MPPNPLDSGWKTTVMNTPPQVVDFVYEESVSQPEGRPLDLAQEQIDNWVPDDSQLLSQSIFDTGTVSLLFAS